MSGDRQGRRGGPSAHAVTPTSCARAKRNAGSGVRFHVIAIDPAATLHTNQREGVSAGSSSIMRKPQPAWQSLRAAKSERSGVASSRKMIHTSTASMSPCADPSATIAPALSCGGRERAARAVRASARRGGSRRVLGAHAQRVGEFFFISASFDCPPFPPHEMGCGASSPQEPAAAGESAPTKAAPSEAAPPAITQSPVSATVPTAVPADHVAILVRGASGLHDADWLLTQKSDPYVIVRIGATGSAWDDPDKRKAEYRSKVVADTLDPTWQLAFRHALDGADPSTREVHLRVFDRDFLSFDDRLGEARVTLAQLASHDNELHDYALAKADGSAAEGTVTLMRGERVEEALIEEARRAQPRVPSPRVCYSSPRTIRHRRWRNSPPPTTRRSSLRCGTSRGTSASTSTPRPSGPSTGCRWCDRASRGRASCPTTATTPTTSSARHSTRRRA